MPNWCFSNITFYSEDENQIASMLAKFKEIMNGEPTKENDFGHGWMGDYANVFFPEIGSTTIECRGQVNGISDNVERKGDYYFFGMDTCTAWGGKLAIWHAIAKKYYPSVKIAYVSEECSTEYFLIYDESGLFYDYKYYIDMCYENKDGEIENIDDAYGYRSLEKIQEYLKKVLPFKFICYKELNKFVEHINRKLSEYEEKHDCPDDLYLQICEFRTVSPSEHPFISGVTTLSVAEVFKDIIREQIYGEDDATKEELAANAKENGITWDELLTGVKAE